MKDLSWKRKGSQPQGVDDVDDWLSKLANVTVFKTNPSGLLDREHFPLQEL
jgi:hypothetical protein